MFIIRLIVLQIIILVIDVIYLGYLGNGPLCFMEFINNKTKESNKTLRELNNTNVILDNNNKHLSDLSNFKVK